MYLLEVIYFITIAIFCQSSELEVLASTQSFDSLFTEIHSKTQEEHCIGGTFCFPALL